jgi:hypothetical protein
MVRAPSPRLRVTLSSTCFATALALAVIMPAVAAEASPAPSETLVPLAPAEAPGPVVTTKLPGAEAIATRDGRYVAVGTHKSRPVAWVSTDGMTWDEADISGSGRGRHMVAVTPTDDGFVAFGYARAGDAERQRGRQSHRILAWHSPDGMAWERATVERPARRGFDVFPAGLADGPARGLADGPGGLLALGSFVGQDLAGQRLWHSADGMAWEPAPLPEVEDAIWFRLISVPGGYVLQGQRGEQRGDDYEVMPSHWRSADGVTWEELPEMPALTDLAAAPDGPIVGIGSGEIWRTSDLVEWEIVWTAPAEWSSPDETEMSLLGWVDWAGDRFLATGADQGACAAPADECPRHVLLESVDGRTWSQVEVSDAWLKDVAADGGSTIVLSLAQGRRPAAAWPLEDTPAAPTTTE